MNGRHKAAPRTGRHGVRRVFALFLLLPALAVLGAQATPAAASEVCPGTHLSPPDNTTESFTYTAPDGYLIAGWCVKAGPTAENHDLSGAPVASVTIAHSSGKEVSHYSVVLVKAPTPVAPAAATALDVCEPATGPTNDRVTIPTDANFTYTLDGAAVAAGSVVATGTTHTVTAVAKDGVVVKEGATTKWTFTFTKVLCDTPPPPTPVAPAAATALDVCEPATGPTNDRVTIPTDANFTYTLDGAAVAAGSVVATGTTHTVTAVAKDGVVVKEGATTKWTFTFTKVLCVTPPPVVPPVVTPPVVTPPVVTPPEVLPEQAFGKAVGSVKATCQGTVRAKLANRSGEKVVYKLRVGKKVHKIAVKSLAKKKFVTKGKPRAKVMLKVGSTRLDKLRIPALCAAPEVLPDTGMRGTS